MVAVVSAAVERLFLHMYKDECAAAEAHATADEDITYPPRRQLLAGGGSLAAIGMQMSQEQNRGAALSVEPEVEQILAWFTAESAIDKGVPAKLWDGVTWHRPVMEKTRAFSVTTPWYGFLVGAHVPEMFRALTSDSFGL